MGKKVFETARNSFEPDFQKAAEEFIDEVIDTI